MPKRKETLELENALIKDTCEKRCYGCEEVTIGFHNAGHGNEVVDFITMDSKGTIKCYELKVTIQDLKSNAKKSWYGHYNYLVITSELYTKIEDWSAFIPEHVGLIVGNQNKGLSVVKKPKKNKISIEDELMLKESMVRSMYWKMMKYKDAQSIEKQQVLLKSKKKAEKEKDIYYKRAAQAENVIFMYEKYKEANDGIEIDLEKMAKHERDKYYEKRRKMRQISADL